MNPLSRFAPRWRLAVLLGIVATVWAPALGACFFWDDRTLILANPVIQHADLGRVFTGDLWGGTTPEARSPFYRPLVLLSFMLDGQVGGGAAWFFHLDSLLWHLGACVLVVALATPRIGRARALVAGAIFGLHPIQSEAVVWSAARNDAMCAAFVLGSLLAFDRRRVALGGALVALAGLSKEAGVVAPALLVAWRLAWRERPKRGELVVSAVAIAGVLALRSRAELGSVAYPPIDPELAALLPGRVAATFLGWLAVPWPLTGATSFYMAAPGVLRWGSAFAAVFGLVAAVRARRGGGWLLAAAGLAFAPTVLAMVSSHLLGERFLYLPLAFLAVLVAAVAPVRLVPVGVLAGVAAIGIAEVRLRDWTSEDALWAAAHARLGDGYTAYRAGRWAAGNGDPKRALHEFRSAVAADPPVWSACAPALQLLLDADAPDVAARLADELAGEGCADAAFAAERAEALRRLPTRPSAETPEEAPRTVAEEPPPG